MPETMTVVMLNFFITFCSPASYSVSEAACIRRRSFCLCHHNERAGDARTWNNKATRGGRVVAVPGFTLCCCSHTIKATSHK